MGEEVDTLEDLLAPKLRAVAVGINPAPRSVRLGHYYQGSAGQTFYRRLRSIGRLPDGDGYEDDRAFAAGIGFTDVVKRPSQGEEEVAHELPYGKPLLQAKLVGLEIDLIVFVFGTAAATFLGRKRVPPGLQTERFGTAQLFCMPRPYARTEEAAHVVHTLGGLLG